MITKFEKYSQEENINETKLLYLTDKIEKLRNIGYEQGLKMIYNWVINRDINFKNFRELCEFIAKHPENTTR